MSREDLGYAKSFDPETDSHEVPKDLDTESASSEWTVGGTRVISEKSQDSSVKILYEQTASGTKIVSEANVDKGQVKDAATSSTSEKSAEEKASDKTSVTLGSQDTESDITSKHFKAESSGSGSGDSLDNKERNGGKRPEKKYVTRRKPKRVPRVKRLVHEPRHTVSNSGT